MAAGYVLHQGHCTTYKYQLRYDLAGKVGRLGLLSVPVRHTVRHASQAAIETYSQAGHYK